MATGSPMISFSETICILLCVQTLISCPYHEPDGYSMTKSRQMRLTPFDRLPAIIYNFNISPIARAMIASVLVTN
jgi:hypothetical protein